MARWWAIVLVWSVVGVGIAQGEETYLLKENVRVGRVTHFKNVFDATSQSETKTDGRVTDHVDEHRRTVLEGTMTVLEVKDGSATKIRVEVDAGSSESDEEKGKPAEKKASPFAGKTIVLTRGADGAVANDFKGVADKDQLHDLGGLLDPDEDNYADHAVAVGDSWEITKNISKRMDLGPKDTVLANCRLDSVKMENGKQIATLSISAALISMDEFVESDIELAGTAQVDVASGAMLGAEVKGPVKISGSKMIQSEGKEVKMEITGSGETSNSSENVPAAEPAKGPAKGAGSRPSAEK